jgi:hypothetical protein
MHHMALVDTSAIERAAADLRSRAEDVARFRLQLQHSLSATNWHSYAAAIATAQLAALVFELALCHGRLLDAAQSAHRHSVSAQAHAADIAAAAQTITAGAVGTVNTVGQFGRHLLGLP